MIEIVSIRKNFVNSTTPVLNDISLRIESGEFFSLLGPSGCGKTTLLRILAGLEKPDAGKVLFNGRDITDLSPQERPFHMVFQRHALFPHLTVFENVAFGLRLQKLPPTEIRERVENALKMVKMTEFANRKPDSLSGGQSQRVALARAIAGRPQVILLDEPLSALDLKLRESMQLELRQLQKNLGITFVYITHDQQEAFSMSDRVAVMSEGRFEQISDPLSLYLQPQSLFSARFVGAAASLPLGVVSSQGAEQVEVDYRGRLLRGMPVGASREGQAYAVIRPECLTCGDSAAEGMNSLSAVVRQSTFRGGWIEVLLETEAGDALSFYRPVKAGGAGYQVGERVEVAFDPADTRIFWSATETVTARAAT
ncbi:MAG: ABC transporter ATP-binding protein [Bdellovibrionaceae bacterium]|nr:ABC transporter ATP-binding protein [Pseudobdellovibrionaceae bacterium]